MKRTEIILAVIVAVAIVLHLFIVPGANILLIVSVALLASIYFYFGFALFNRIRLRKIFKKESYYNVSAKRITGAIGAGFGLSILLFGILFKLMRWPGSSANLLAGLVMIAVISIPCVVMYIDNHSDYCKGILKRSITIGMLGAIAFIIPSTYITRFKYRNYPTYLEAFEKHQQNPDDVELMHKMEEERQKMNEGK